MGGIILFYKDLTPQFFLKLLIKHLKFIILLTVIGTVLTLLYANFFITPQYSASAMVIVQNYTMQDAARDAAEAAAEQGIDDSDGDENDQINDVQDDYNKSSKGTVKIYSSDLTASTTLAGYCTTLFSNNVEIGNMLNGCAMSITQLTDSNFLTITMTSSNPQTASDVCNAVANRIAGTKEQKGLFDEIFAAGGVTVIRYASVPSSSIYPNVQNFALYGFIGGLVISLVISFILEIIDTTVKYEDDLFKMYKIPVFGEILDFDLKGGKPSNEAKTTYYQ